MLFLTSGLANKVVGTRYTTKARVPGRGIMGNDIGVYKFILYVTYIVRRS